MGVMPVTTYPHALDLIRQHALQAPDLKVRTVPIEDALGRITADDLISPEILPAFDNSAMDGYAILSAHSVQASEENPIVFRVLGQLAAGDTPIQHPIESESETEHDAWEIMTGAPFPEGFDACVRVEDVQVLADSPDGSARIQIQKPVAANQNRRVAGEDFRVGSIVLPRGHKIRAEDILCLASLGMTQLQVFARPRVGIISTGKELVEMHKAPDAGQIRNSTAPFLLASLRAQGCDVVHLGTIEDRPEAFAELVSKVQKHDLDLVITTGAISMGKFDFVGSSLKSLGVEFYFKKVALRPGKPILFGKLNAHTFIVSLPGNPISGAVGFRFFVVPFLRTLQRQTIEVPYLARLAHSTYKPEGSTCFFKGHLQAGKDGPEVRFHAQQKPSLMHPLLTSHVWICLPESGQDVPAGQWVETYPF